MRVVARVRFHAGPWLCALSITKHFSQTALASCSQLQRNVTPGDVTRKPSLVEPPVLMRSSEIFRKNEPSSDLAHLIVCTCTHTTVHNIPASAWPSRSSPQLVLVNWKYLLSTGGAWSSMRLENIEHFTQYTLHTMHYTLHITHYTLHFSVK